MEKEKLVSLVSAAQKGDSNALNELFNSFYNDVYYFALKTVKDDELACDITQEAFIEIINTIGNLKEPAAFVTWMKQITYHQCTRYFKKKKDVLVDEDEEGNTVFDTLEEQNAEFIPDEALEKSDFKKTILAMLDELSEEQRSATMMYYFDEMSVKQIAEIQGVSEGTVKSRLNYARKSIKSSVEEYEKKNNVKLHAIPLFPLFKWLLEDGFASCIPTVSVAEGVSAATGVSVTATATASATAGAAATAATASATTAAGATAATASTATAVGIGAKIAALPLVTKIVAGVVATVIVAGTTAATVSSITGNSIFAGPGNISSSSSQNSSSKPLAAEEIILEGIIPEGCIYKCADGTELTAGDAFPEKCTAGDTVTYGDYVYGYECILAVDQSHKDKLASWVLWKDIFDSGDSGLEKEDVFGGWTPQAADKTKESYGTIVTRINKKPITNLYMTFESCLNLKTAPAIPSTVTSISTAFMNCVKLSAAPLIPKNVRRMMMAFYSCPSLKGDIYIDAELDTSLAYYYSDVFTVTQQDTETDTYKEELINLVGNASKNDLILIAENSKNKNILVHGNRAQFTEGAFGDLNKITAEEALHRFAGHMNDFDMPHFKSPNEISIDDAARFSFGEWAGYDADGSFDTTGDRTAVEHILSQMFDRKFDLTTLTGKRATYNAADDSVTVKAKSISEGIYHSAEFSKLIENDNRSYSVRIYCFKETTKEIAAQYEGKKELVRTDEEAGKYYLLSKSSLLTVSKKDGFWKIDSYVESVIVASDFEGMFPSDETDSSIEEQESEEQMLASLKPFSSKVAHALLFSSLPYFDSVSSLTVNDVFWFEFDLLDINGYLVSDDGAGTLTYQIPVTDIDISASTHFGQTYDFTSLSNTQDPFAQVYTASYKAQEGADVIEVVAFSGAGTSTTIAAVDYIQLNSSTYQVNFNQYDAGDPETIDKSMKMIVDYLGGGWRIISYSER